MAIRLSSVDTPLLFSQVRREDKLPKLICERCYDHLASWYRFKELCFSTDSFLQQFVNSIYPNTQEDHSEEYMHQGRKCSNIASKQTQTMPIVELIVSDESSKGLSDGPHHNKENNQKKSPPVGRKRKSTITEHCIKANEPGDVVMLNDRAATGKTKTLVRCKKCRRKKCKCKPKRKRGLAKGVQLNGLKPGSHLKVQGRQYLVVGAKSYPKQTANLVGVTSEELIMVEIMGSPACDFEGVATRSSSLSGVLPRFVEQLLHTKCSS
uniref:ZAD domain-containing protein n=1 Tax=Timema bartmani TaxID=61472 RepID=A0A7R9F415_9NEOP|nr:unnamed protein product [Timema bartmani]